MAHRVACTASSQVPSAVRAAIKSRFSCRKCPIVQRRQGLFVEGNIAGEGGGVPFDLVQIFIEVLGQGDAFGKGPPGGDAVNFAGDGIALGEDEAVCRGQFVASLVN